VSPWWYHAVLSSTALVYYHFINSLRKDASDLEYLVRKADEGLANIIEGLPSHLQPYGDETQDMLDKRKDLEEHYPWIQWQRTDLISALLLWRSKINYECRRYWAVSVPSSIPRRVLCLQSAKSVINLLESANMPINQRRFM
jgi:hypothetical protein